jgi:hypothetical protein
MALHSFQSNSGKVNPAVVVAVILIAAAGAGAWYYMGRDTGPSLPEGVKVMVDGKEVDPKSVIKDGTIQLKDGASFTFAKDGLNPHTLMSQKMDEFFALPEGAARTKYLDDHINQQEEMRKKMDITTDANGAAQVKVASDTSPSTQPTKKLQIRAGSGAMDSMPPELKSQLAEFAAAVAKRRAERGLPPAQGMMMIRTKQSQ